MTVRQLILAASVVLASTTPPTHAGIPVIDVASLSQLVISTIESIAQTLKQIEQYTTQLQQYENQLQNTLAPASYIWDAAQTTMTELRNTVDTISYYKTRLGSIDNYLEKFQHVDYYKQSPCFTPTGCDAASWAALENIREFASEAQKETNTAVMEGLAQQQESLVSDAQRLEDLQAQAQGADGQMKAMQAANQLASQQTNQLLQIRSLLLTQQNVATTRLQAQVDEEAQRTAMEAKLRSGSYNTSPIVNW